MPVPEAVVARMSNRSLTLACNLLLHLQQKVALHYRQIAHDQAMQPKTEEFLNLLLWSADMLAHPTYRNLTMSYEGWTYRKGLQRQITTLERQQMLERDAGARDERLHRLTERGRLHVLGGRDPVERWARPWDGQWRLVLFDVPVGQNARRERLRRFLRDNHFGCLQNSVWASPDPLVDEAQILQGAKIDVETLIMLDARPRAGESDAEIVAGAWDFKRINGQYAQHLKVLDKCPDGLLREVSARKALQRWAEMERAAWRDAVRHDPLLPRRILPSDYLGQQAWMRRVEVLRKASNQLRSFRSDED